MFKKVILPVCGKTHCSRARLALSKVEDLCDGEFILVHIMDPIPATVGGDARRELENSSQAKGLEILGPMIELLESKKLPFHTRVVNGPVAEMIARVAENEHADLIAMVTDGRDDFADIFLGSVTERVLRDTAVDLLAIKPANAFNE